MQVCLANSSTKGRLPPAHRHDKKVFTMAGITEKQKNIFHHAREIIKQDESIPEEEKEEQIVRTAMANPLDKFELGIRKLIEDLMIERMGENDKIVTRYMADQEFQGSAFPILAREIFEAVRSKAADTANSGQGPATQG